ncbi:hypothetical protein SAMN05216404_11958 [Nitrosospira multiformis]|uniref:Uncharacterized protein n=1 Tax=Nitrosospira multiformis TaxID=1231 RepID=A0A1H8P953_9PROT|nr:hypothetical protein [Nitrosospira multiformis]SEO38470.1 hypothetical protein SAMN05216404_11958 [Nitrosospira multiformis]
MNDPTSKMYAHLTPVELAPLAVKYMVAGDERELARIRSACPLKTYTMQDSAYIDRIESFLRMANAWGLLYWQYQHERMRAALCMLITLSKGIETEEAEHEMEGRRFTLNFAESCLLAIDIALDEVCAARGFDAADARKIVDAKVFVPRKSSQGQAVPDTETVAKVKELLLCILMDRN